MAWTIDKKEVACKCKALLEEKPNVVLSKKAVDQIKTLLKASPNLEWGAGMIGTELKPNEIWIQEIKLVEQKCSMGTFSFTPKGDVEMGRTQNVIGWIHSHCNMQPFASGTDDTTDLMYRVAITVNNNLEYFTRVMVKLPCGGIEKIVVETYLEEDFVEDKDIAEQAKTLLQEEKFEYDTGVYNSGVNLMEKQFHKVNNDVVMTNGDWVMVDGKGVMQRSLSKDDCSVCGQKMGQEPKRVQCNTCLEYIHRTCTDKGWNDLKSEWGATCYRCLKAHAEDYNPYDADFSKSYYY